ncbi:hypothetical protein HMPREF2767_06950 [Nosocomiicoccus sp. HMSC067E10]|uniref:hypothetical protein n=1 Tax=Nosocomiicoccus sp. HMSC067E10 TaxID=1739271 RepID=UPI0008A596B0|nr:hypothetical protein [Nosocomiicoccus sp. HMSC067E10]OFL48859.1 hypothetical protein HMPREF2767_06950 [Nosocomiicoccus sp. HMSC067E10]
MKEKLRMAATILPVLLVPLLKNRNEIKDHPDVQKLAKNSNILYSKAKDKTQTVTEAGVKGFNETRDFVSEKYHASKDKREYNKQMKAHDKSLSKLNKLEAQFEADKEKHRKKRMESLLSTETLNHDEKESRMNVSKGHQKLTTERPDTTNVKELNEQFVEQTEYEDDYSPGALHLKHKDLLDPRSAHLREEAKERKVERAEKRDDSLFGKHRRQNERHIENHGRKTGYGEKYQKSDSLKQFIEWKDKHND